MPRDCAARGRHQHHHPQRHARPQNSLAGAAATVLPSPLHSPQGLRRPGDATVVLAAMGAAALVGWFALAEGLKEGSIAEAPPLLPRRRRHPCCATNRLRPRFAPSAERGTASRAACARGRCVRLRARLHHLDLRRLSSRITWVGGTWRSSLMRDERYWLRSALSSPF